MPPSASERRSAGLSIRARLSLTYSALILSTGLAMIVAVRITISVMNGALVDTLYQVAAVTVLVVAAVGALASWFVAGRMLRPLQRLNTVARAVDETTLGTRLNMTGPVDEIRSLSDTFDVMFARLEAAFAGRALFAANASHELRTPLATMKTMLQVELKGDLSPQTRETYERLLLTVESMSATTGALLDLAQGQEVEGDDEVDLSELVRAAVEDEVRQDSLDVTLHLPPTPIAGDRRLLQNLVSNLVRNAVVHNTPRGWVRVAVESAIDGRVILTVENSGEVVPDDVVPLLAEPFYRARLRTAGGHGLGLALVRAIADAHRARVVIEAGRPSGLRVIVTFAAPTSAHG
ncbi:sensor histidine kinase [Microbacterium sp. P06]|uniref:sensor histidine kinase n=1 Tax=Microbacterium sp. P06 TaxID=3366949 RepID=UPI00374570D5